MRRQVIPWRCAALSTSILLASAVHSLAATPVVNSAVINLRIFNDCPTSTLTVTNNYPSAIEIEDSNLSCDGFANFHNWSLSGDGSTAAVFANDSAFSIAADLLISGAATTEAGLRISPWWSLNVDGRFNVRTSNGEVAVFGGRLPYHNFTASSGLYYTVGTTLTMIMIYRPNGLSLASPATIEYRVDYQGSQYSSGELLFDEGNPTDDPPHGLWGILTPAQVGGFVNSFMEVGNPVTSRATFTNILFGGPDEPDIIFNDGFERGDASGWSP